MNAIFDPQHFFDKIFCISVKERVDRQKTARKAFETLGILERVEPTEQLILIDRCFPRSRDVLTLCSCCKRALVEPSGWLEIEDAAARLHLLEEERAPQLRHAVCPDCLAAHHIPPVAG